MQFLLHLQCVYRLSNAALSSIFRFITTFLCVLSYDSVNFAMTWQEHFLGHFILQSKNSMINCKENVMLSVESVKLFHFQQCIEKIGRIQKSKVCSFQCYPFRKGNTVIHNVE